MTILHVHTTRTTAYSRVCWVEGGQFGDVALYGTRLRHLLAINLWRRHNNARAQSCVLLCRHRGAPRGARGRGPSLARAPLTSSTGIWPNGIVGFKLGHSACGTRLSWAEHGCCCTPLKRERKRRH